MLWNEEKLKRHLKEEDLLPLYVLYGEECFLTCQYAEKLRLKTAPEDELASFNIHRLDGLRCSFDEIEEAAEAMPLMALRSCVTVRDYDIGGKDREPTHSRLVDLVSDPPESCVMIFFFDAIQPSGKSARWKEFLTAAEKSGAVIRLDRRTPDEVVRMLVSGAARRGCTMRPDTARMLLDWCGNDLNLLTGELDKLSALAQGGEIDRALVERATPRNLESRAYELSNAILAGQYTKAYEVLNALFYQREEPIMINGALASAWADLYRVKVAASSGKKTAELIDLYPGYAGKEKRLSHVVRDASRLSLFTLRQGLEVLAETDRLLKSGGKSDQRMILEKTAARLILLTGRGN